VGAVTYTLLRGKFVIRYPDLPRQGPEPDGDTVKFRPDTPGLVEGLPRRSGTPADLNARGISVRLEGVDALETHFAESHQELAGANLARDELLRFLGFTGVTFWPDLPNKVQSADADELPGYVLSNGIDANGRLIGFVYPGLPDLPDGAEVFLDEPLVDRSANVFLVKGGHAYPAFYATLPVQLRNHFAGLSRAARAAVPPVGLWPRSTADPNGPAKVVDLDGLERLVVWPKLFRRLVPYLAAGHTSFDGFDAWLRQDPVHRDDQIFLLTTGEHGNLHDVVVGAGEHIQLTVWPEDFIISPDPAPGGGTPPVPVPSGAVTGDLVIVAALPNPTGVDTGNELVTLINTTSTSLDLTRWALADTTGKKHPLGGMVAAGATIQVTLGTAVQLGNRGDAVILTDRNGQVIDRVAYTAGQVREGRTICFGRAGLG
jgi:hypothetical protein